jgi:serine/threonine protein kinase
LIKNANLINRGAYGFIFKCERIHDQQIFAMKVSIKQLSSFDKENEEDKNEIQDLFEEIKLMKNFPHPFIVEIIDDFINS